MKIAVLSDIHGFSIALEHVLSDIESRDNIDHIIAAGDICETGPDPAGSLDLLRTRQIEIIQGNTDQDLANPQFDSPRFNWTLAQLGPDRVDLLRNLPNSIRIAPPDGSSPEDELLVVHADPQSLTGGFQPDASDQDVREILDGTVAGAIGFGHVHVAYQRQIDRTLLVDVSAVGNPKDQDLRPRWALLEWDVADRRWTAEHHYIPYPLEETRRQLDTCGMPKPDKVFRKLVHASYHPMQ